MGVGKSEKSFGPLLRCGKKKEVKAGGSVDPRGNFLNGTFGRVESLQAGPVSIQERDPQRSSRPVFSHSNSGFGFVPHPS